MMTRLRTRLRRWVRADDGQAAVEFALVLPFLLILLIGIVEFGRAWNEHQVITDAAREAARACVIFDPTVTEANVKTVAKRAMATAAIDTTRPTIVVAVTGFLRPNPTGQPCTVAIQLPYRFTFFGPLVAWSTGYSTITLNTSFTMRNE
jgi:Flp pilus assembly protein TadG